MKTKLILTMLLASTMLLQGCGLQKMIEQAINNMKPVQTVTGTIELQNATNHSGTVVKCNTVTTTTDTNGHFRLTLATSAAQSVNELIISHTGYVTENVTVPAETENGEYTTTSQTLTSMPTPIPTQKAIQNPLLFTKSDKLAERILFSVGELMVFITYSLLSIKSYLARIKYNSSF